jgi:transposase InsO family protein
MQLHANAALSLNKRLVLARRVVEEGWTLTKAAEAAEVSVRTTRKWVRRHRAEGEAGLLDRSSRPHSSPTATSEQRVQLIASLRATRMTGAEIAEVLAMPITTVQGILTRIGLGKRSRLDAEHAVRYERSRPGELLHVDVKKLGRIERGAGRRVTGRKHYTPRRGPHGAQRNTVGWEFCHVAIDDFSRLAYVEVLGDERAATAIGFLRRALCFFAAHGIKVERVMTDNGSAYVSVAHALACRALGIRHLRTRPRRPQTNGKAERFIRTMLEGWAYGRIYSSSKERTDALGGWLDFYNRRRPHGALGRQPPVSRLGGNNLLGSYTYPARELRQPARLQPFAGSASSDSPMQISIGSSCVLAQLGFRRQITTPLSR